MTRLWVAMSLAPFLLACSSQQAETAPPPEQAANVHPESGLQVIPLTVKSGDTVHSFDVEVAKTAQEQARGLMFRTKLGPNKGMLFPREPAAIASFWMKNTVIPLDIIFIDPDNRIINIASETVPYSTESSVSDAPAAAVLELAGGRAEELGIMPGDLVEW